MSESTKPSRIRSPSYPSIDLKTAVERAEELYNFGKRSPVLVSVILPKWGYNQKSANGMKIVAALKSYGLIEDSGKLSLRKIQLTDSAYRIIHDHKGSPERLKAIQAAALKPEVYKYCWDEFRGPKDMPHDDAIRAHLILEKKFNKTAVSGFLTDYNDTLEYAKLEDVDTINAGRSDSGEHEESVVAIETQTNLGKIQASPGTNETIPPLQIGMKQDTFTLDEGQVVVQWPAELTPESFEDFTDWLELLHRKIGRSVEAEKKPALKRDDAKG
jgi:hypothetical protein